MPLLPALCILGIALLLAEVAGRPAVAVGNALADALSAERVPAMGRCEHGRTGSGQAPLVAPNGSQPVRTVSLEPKPVCGRSDARRVSGQSAVSAVATSGRRPSRRRSRGRRKRL